MAEWKLADEPPERREDLIARGWMGLESQPGFAQRAQMVVDVVLHAGPVKSITDLGCGDGSLLARLALALLPAHIPMWGYDLGAGDLAHGRVHGLDVRFADILADELEYGELVIASEVVEHLADPEGFLRRLPGRLLIVSSPSTETGDWHNPIHAWAWDLDGYAALVRRAGWTVTWHVECDGGMNGFGGVPGPQRFQAVLAVRGAE